MTQPEEGLFIIVFQDALKAKQALTALKQLHKQKSIQLKRGATIVRYQNGHFDIRETHDLNLTEKRLGLVGLGGALLASFLVIPLGPSGLVLALAIGAASAAAVMGIDLVLDFGFKDSFLREVERRLEKDCSAIVAIVNFREPEIALPACGVMRGGKIIEQHLPPEIYQKLGQIVEIL